MKQSKHTFLASLVALMMLGSSSVLAAGLSARIRPDTVAIGESAQLEISVESSTDPSASQAPSVPNIPGLEISPAGRSSRMSVVNGTVSASTSYTYRVTANRAGTFQISGIQNGSARARPITLEVSNTPAQNARAPSSAASAAAPTRTSRLAFLRLDLPKKKLFAGQSVPITVRGYFRGGTGVTLTGPPTMNTDAFTITGLDADPAQSQTSIKGQDYLAVTWRGLLTAVKSGSHDLKVTLPATIQYQEMAPRPTPRSLPSGPQRGSSLLEQMMNDDAFSDDAFSQLRDSMLNDPFFNDPFFNGSGIEQVFGRVVSKDLTLSAQKGNIRVAALPSSGRPADFTGAVGNFDLSTKLERTDLIAGEPATLDIIVSGHGNFSGVSAATLADSPDWRAYAPHADFAPSDKTGYEGTKTFEQSVTARVAGASILPAISLSYFDPDTESYVTKVAPPIHVNVDPGQVSNGVNGGAVLDLRAEPAGEASPALRAQLGQTVPSLARGGVPALLPLAALSLLLLSLLSALVLAARRSAGWRERSRQRRENRASRRYRQQMKRAVLQSDSAAFFTSARRSMQHRLAAVWNLNPESITEHELVSRWPTAPGDLREVFRLADQVEYFNDSVPDTNLETWMSRLDKSQSHLPTATNTQGAPIFPNMKALP